MAAGLAVLVGIGLGFWVWTVARRSLPPAVPRPDSPTSLGWWALILGAVGAASLIVGSGWLPWLPTGSIAWPLASIVCVTAAVPVAISALLRGDRRWPAWTGLALGGAPALLWLAFLVGNLVGG